MCVYTYVFVHVCMGVCTYVYMYVCIIYLFSIMNVCMYTNLLTQVFICVSKYATSTKTKTVSTVTNHMNTVLVEKLIVTKLICPQVRGTTPVRVHIYPSFLPWSGPPNSVYLVKKLIYNASNWPNFSYFSHFQTLRSKILSSGASSQIFSNCLLPLVDTPISVV